MTKSPCQNCTERYFACWDTCPKYAKYLKLHKEEKEAYRKSKNPIINRGGFLGSRGPIPGKPSKGSRRT